MTLDPQPLAPAVAAAEKAGWTTLRVDLAGVRSKAELMRRWGAALAVPAWFGGNWDALADALIDLSWLPRAPGRLVAVTSWSSYAGARPGDWETLQEVLEGAVEYWRDAEEGALAVVLAEPPPAG
ncbi:barstar family protein [Streptomyces sp. NPDC057686]|uniref:barstar family protein n=1 Tax=unclassified Streptomyces TaxID=2593676 RepID=UPI0036C406BA